MDRPNEHAGTPRVRRVAVIAALLGLGLQMHAKAQDGVIGAPDPTTPVEASTAPTTPVETSAASTTPPENMLIPLATPEDRGLLETAEGENLINVTVENETLENVVNMFARISGANIVTTSADLGGTVTVNMRAVAWKPALSAILDVHNLALAEKLPGSGVYTIVPKTGESQEPLRVEPIFLKFTTVPDIAPMIRSMIGSVSNAAVSELASRNAIVVKTTEANMLEIHKLVGQMDVAGRQVVVETKFMELADGISKKLGIRWDSLDEWGGTLQLDPLDYARSVTRTESRSETDTFNGTYKKRYDQDGNLLNDPVSVLQLPDGTVPPFLLLNTDPSTQLLQTETTSAGTTYDKSSSEAQAAVLEMDDFQAVISALNKTEGVTTISNPKLVVASGSRDAYFTVGDREPIIKVEVTRGTEDSPGDTITAELDTSITTEYIKQGYLETGIHLEVIPVVKTENLIEATITPKLVRRVLPDKVVGDNSWPRIAVKQINTTFTLRSGQTVAIGGLTDNLDDKKVSKVPFLGDIPLIGKYLFSHSADIKRQVETIIFVTLSMAEADTLYQEAGIPEEAELVHKQMIRRTHRQEAFEAELEDMRKAAEMESHERARNRLLKRPR